MLKCGLSLVLNHFPGAGPIDDTLFFRSIEAGGERPESFQSPYHDLSASVDGGHNEIKLLCS